MTDTPRAKPDPARRSGPKLARHLAKCVPCRGSLDAIAAQSNVLAVLGELPTRPDGEKETLVERTLRVTANEGREVLADYVYHLARACLEVAAASQTRTRDPALYPPPGVAQCSAMVKKLDSRGSIAEQISQKTLLLEAISGTGSIRQAESCIELLRKLEGRSARADFLSARCALLQEDYARVVEILTPMLGMNVPGWLWLAIRWHLMSAFLRSGRAGEALKIGQQAVELRPEDRSLLYNLATAHASLGDEQGFDRVVSQFATSASVDDGRNWRGIIELDADWFAARIDRSKEQILRAFANTGGGG